jgi:hypothetical protein
MIHMHRVLLDLPDGCGLETDHINGDGLDNRKSNLRACTRAENGQNQRAQSGFRGVSWRSDRQRWRAKAMLGGCLYHLGHYTTAEEAHRVVEAWRAEHMPFAVARTA